MKIYIANALFSESDRDYNLKLYDKLKENVKDCDIYLPQLNMEINDKTKSANSIQIYEGDTQRLKEADILIAIIDTPDLGVATEIGLVAGWNELSDFMTSFVQKKNIIGLYTDTRDASLTMSDEKNKFILESGLAENQYDYKNLYTVGAIKKYGKLCHSIDEVVETIKEGLLNEEK